jgi:hypothetical protein
LLNHVPKKPQLVYKLFVTIFYQIFNNVFLKVGANFISPCAQKFNKIATTKLLMMIKKTKRLELMKIVFITDFIRFG